MATNAVSQSLLFLFAVSAGPRIRSFPLQRGDRAREVRCEVGGEKGTWRCVDMALLKHWSLPQEHRSKDKETGTQNTVKTHFHALSQVLGFRVMNQTKGGKTFC